MTADQGQKGGHTKGPWRVVGGEICGPDGKSVAFVSASRMTAEDVMSRNGPATANARLIAAAPELLAALKAVVKIADRKTDEFDAAKAAIAKATGAG